MEYKCKNCQKDLSKEAKPELIDVCYECVHKKYGPFQKYIYHTNLNFVPKPKKDGEQNSQNL